MSEVACKECVKSSALKIELRECEVIHVGVHLVAWPCQIQEVEEGVKGYDKECNVSIR